MEDAKAPKSFPLLQSLQLPAFAEALAALNDDDDAPVVLEVACSSRHPRLLWFYKTSL
jgi:hypothetical protein